MDDELEINGLVQDQSSQAVICTLCRRSLASDVEAIDDLVAFNLCGDCKFLLFEDLATPPDVHRRHTSRRSRRRNRQSSSESVEQLFSQQFSLMVNMMRQNQPAVSELEDPSMDMDYTARSLQQTSSRTTPTGSTRWRRILSDTESDGYDNIDYFYGDSESNLSFGRYRGQGESDAVSFSNYGGDTDASMDGHSIIGTELFINPDNGSDFDSDTDIDPMHTGLSQWNWDNVEEDVGEEDGEWEEADAEEESVQFTISRTGLQDLFIPSPSERNFPIVSSPINLRHARGFEQLLDQLAETDNSRRGAPPASISFVSNLPRVVFSEEHGKHESAACAICKDGLSVGTEVSQLPCLHIYHPSCILPWLSARNSCPLCRYELPTDDKDYEEGKRRSNSRVSAAQIQEQYADDESSSANSSDAESVVVTNMHRLEPGPVHNADSTTINSSRENGIDWFFRAAAPIVGIVGMALVFWLGKPLIPRSGSASPSIVPALGQHQVQCPGQLNLNRRVNRSRRWWLLF